MTVREFRKRLHKKRLEAIHAEVLAEKKKPTTSEKDPSKVRQKGPVPGRDSLRSVLLPSPESALSVGLQGPRYNRSGHNDSIFGHYAGGETSGLEGLSRKKYKRLGILALLCLTCDEGANRIHSDWSCLWG
jgi:hypothetical protein